MEGGIEQDRNSKGNLRYLGYDEVVQTDRKIEIVWKLVLLRKLTNYLEIDG